MSCWPLVEVLWITKKPVANIWEEKSWATFSKCIQKKNWKKFHNKQHSMVWKLSLKKCFSIDVSSEVVFSEVINAEKMVTESDGEVTTEIILICGEKKFRLRLRFVFEFDMKLMSCGEKRVKSLNCKLFICIFNFTNWSIKEIYSMQMFSSEKGRVSFLGCVFWGRLDKGINIVRDSGFFISEIFQFYRGF